MTLIISLPADVESRLHERAKAAGQEMSQFVEQLLTREIAGWSASTAKDAALDAQYERGYMQLPEDVTDLTALLPHLGVESEQWE